MVSPVIGVILMVAITVILDSATGSSVFGQGTAEAVCDHIVALLP